MRPKINISVDDFQWEDVPIIIDFLEVIFRGTYISKDTAEEWEDQLQNAIECLRISAKRKVI